METRKAVPYSAYEKEMFKKLVHSKWDIIGQNAAKNYDAWQTKAAAWQEITNKFNAENGEGRCVNVKQMKKLWQNLKTERKEYRKESLAVKLPKNSSKSTNPKSGNSSETQNSSCVSTNSDTSYFKDLDNTSASHFLASNTSNISPSKPNTNVTIANKQDPLGQPVTSLQLPSNGFLYQIILPSTTLIPTANCRPILPKPGLEPELVKYKRSLYSVEENMLLQELVAEYQEIISNKKLDSANLSNKKRAWESITVSFNKAELGPKRTSFQLKKLWENIKFKRKHRSSENTLLPQGASQDFDGTSQGFEGTSQGLDGTLQGFEGTPQGFDGTSQGLDGTLQGFEDTSQGSEGTSQGFESTSQSQETANEVAMESEECIESKVDRELISIAEPICEIKTEQDYAGDDDPTQMSEQDEDNSTEDEISMQDDMNFPEKCSESDKKEDHFSIDSSSSCQASQEVEIPHSTNEVSETSQPTDLGLHQENGVPCQQSSTNVQSSLRELYQLKAKKHDLKRKMLKFKMTYTASMLRLERQILKKKRDIWPKMSDNATQMMDASQILEVNELKLQILEKNKRHLWNLKLENELKLLELKKVNLQDCDEKR